MPLSRYCRHALRLLCALACSSLLLACQSTGPSGAGIDPESPGMTTPGATGSNQPQQSSAGASASELPLAVRDFSGHWEKNYQLSDDFGARIALYIADIQRRYNAPSQGGDFRAGAIRSDAINGLARFTEELTRMPTLAIDQQATGISIEREQDFTLRCNYGAQGVASGGNAFGADACGWNGQRLIFTMQLGGGLGITHQFSLSADGEMLDLTTTVVSDSVAAPLTVRNLYRRYEPPADPYNCVLTLTRSRVCNQRGAGQ